MSKSKHQYTPELVDRSRLELMFKMIQLPSVRDQRDQLAPLTLRIKIGARRKASDLCGQSLYGLRVTPGSFGADLVVMVVFVIHISYEDG